MFTTYIWYFTIVAFIGWIVETIYQVVRYHKIVDTGFLTGPFCPIHGVCALIFLFILYPFQHNLFIFFPLAIIFTIIIEYITSLILELIFHVKFWDYTNFPLNFKGIIALPVSLFWGFLAVIYIKFLHPLILPIANYLSNHLGSLGILLIFLYFLFDIGYTTISLLGLKSILKKFELIKDQIQTDDLFKALKRNHRRIIKSFPSMSSKKFSLLADLKKYFCY